MKSANKILKLFLILTAIHSLAVGLGLIVLPNSMIELFGFVNQSDRFFRTQGGVFHIVMALGYYIASRRPSECDYMIYFIIAVKLIATIFLLSYYIFITPIITVILSGIADFAMALAIYYLQKASKFELKQSGKE